MAVEKPAGVFDRDREWSELVRFASGAATGPRLGVIYGRRRQGKSFLLRAVAEATGGLYHQALEEDRPSALASLAICLARDSKSSAAPTLRGWDEAFRALVGQAGARRLVVLDEFPFLALSAPELPSVIQRAFDEARSAPERSFRLLLCGSAISVMSTMLTGAKPLRGRASLQQVALPFDFREAARFWKLQDPGTAFLVHSVLGGTPGYRDLLEHGAPTRPAQLADWLGDGVLNPSHALFTEADYLLTEDPAITDRALYQSVVSLITQGVNTQRELGGRLGKSDQAMQHPLLVLERAGFIRREPDVLLSKRPLLRIADTMLRFHHAVLRPELARFEARQTRDAWKAAAKRFEAQVLGPHFEQLARDWTARFASPETLGGVAHQVGFTAVNDPQAKRRFEVDVAVVGASSGPKPTLLAIGEAKGGAGERGLDDLGRLESLRSLLGARAVTRSTRLLLFSRGGFSSELVQQAKRRDDVELVDLDRLYGGD